MNRFKNPKRTRKINHKAEKRKLDLVEAGRIYANWRHLFCQTPCKPWNLAARVLALRDQLEKEIKNRKVRAFFREMVEHSFKKVVEKYGTAEHPRIEPQAPEEGEEG